MRVAILTGGESQSTVESIEQLCRIPGVEVAGILVDTHRSGWKRRYKNLRRNLRREGLSYLPHRLSNAVRNWLEAKAEAVVSPEEVHSLLRSAFPERCFRFADLSAMYGISVQKVGSLNSGHAAEALRALNADLGIVLGTRVLKRSTFSVPRLGSINLHKGKVPEYRGMPPAFWELYDGASSAGVTVHFVDDGLDTGDVVARSTVPIEAMETVRSLKRKLDLEGASVLASAVAAIASGNFPRNSQEPYDKPVRTVPSRRQQTELAKRLGTPLDNDLAEAAKLALYWFIYHSGMYRAIRSVRRLLGIRAAVVLYHRVNDDADDPLTVSLERFAQHLLLLRKHRRPVRTEAIVAMLQGQAECEHGAVAVHFDDCYRDVFTQGRLLLRECSVPACFFISSGFLDTGRRFEHDRARYPQRFENLSRVELAQWCEEGFEVGAHTVNHCDLGLVSGDEAKAEIVDSGRELAAITGSPVESFSYPFGFPKNITQENRKLVEQSGYRAMFAAHGGFVRKNSDLFNIPRFGVSGQHLPLRFLMDLEGLTFFDAKRYLNRLLGRS